MEFHTEKATDYRSGLKEIKAVPINDNELTFNFIFCFADFGKERLEEEKTLGPKELRRLKGEDNEDDNKDDSDDDLDHYTNSKKEVKRQAAAMERVRQYQVNRLKYYYAVVQFDSVETASK